MNMIKTSFCWWYGWKPEKVENWLEEMESKGWNLYQVDFNSVRFKFKKGEAKRVSYCADFQPTIDDQYIKLFIDDGWELVWSGAHGWYIWKKAYEKERPLIYSDITSLIDRNNRLVKILASIFIPLLIIFIMLICSFAFIEKSAITKIVIWMYIVIITIYIYLFAQLYRHNKKLVQNNIKEK